MSNSVFKKWTNAVRHLNEKIKNNTLIAGRNIQLENTGYGIRIHGQANNTPGGDTYKGYFKAIQTDTNKIKIVDGFDIEAANCGKVQVNKLASQSVSATELTITADAFIYRQSVAVMTNSVMTSATVTIEQSASYPEWEAGKEKELISRVTFADSKITDFDRHHVPSRVNIIGAC